MDIRGFVRLSRVIALPLLAAAPAGCNSGIPLPGTLAGSGNELSGVGLEGRGNFAEIETNDGFGSANVLPPDGATITVIRAEIGGPSDVDLFDLGPVGELEHVIVKVTAAAALDARLALFDEEGNALIVDDTHNVIDGQSGVFVHATMPSNMDHAYAAVSAEAQSGAGGSYSLVIQRSPESDPQQPAPQTVYLNFAGQSAVKLGPRPVVDIPAFDTGLIMSKFSGKEDEIIERLLDNVRADYAGLNVTFLSSRSDALPPPPYAMVFVGGYDPGLLGVAEAVDEFNSDLGQQAIVFANTFAAFGVLNPSHDQIAQAMANVVSHEVGHLLGLSHTRDPRAIMDVSATLRQLLADQTFETSPLDAAVFPLGGQDSIECLLSAIGGDPAVAGAVRAAPAELEPAASPSESAESPARSLTTFTMCFCQQCVQSRQKARAADQDRVPRDRGLELR